MQITQLETDQASLDIYLDHTAPLSGQELLDIIAQLTKPE